MKKIIVLLFTQFSFTLFLFSQEEFLIQKSQKGSYINHKLTPKENFYSIGRLFNVPPKTLAAFNGLDMKKGLSIGQVLRIPLTDSNFSRKNNDGVPVYYTAAAKENLVQVSNANNKISLENLRKWNDLNDDKINAGQKIIVGFIVAGEIAKSKSQNIQKSNEITVTEKKDISKIISSDTTTNENKISGQEKIINRPDSNIQKKEDKPSVKEEVKKQDEKTTKDKPSIVDNAEGKEGYFKNDFDQQVKTFPLSKDETVTAGTFKITNGNKEAKYYALMDKVEPGTIIKVVNPVNNKAIYAKVLGEMKGIRQNEGLDMRISIAAALALEIAETEKFIVKLNY